MSTEHDAGDKRHDNFSSPKVKAIQPAGPENLARLESNLWRNESALQYLFDYGLTRETIRKFHLGIKDPYKRKADGKVVRGVLCYPSISFRGEKLGRYGYHVIPGVTENMSHGRSYGPGKPISYYSGAVDSKTILLVADTCWDLWVLDQQLGATRMGEQIAIISPSHDSDIPTEWKEPEFWSSWQSVYFVHSAVGGHEQKADAIIKYCGREVCRLSIPEKKWHRWSEFFLAGGTPEQFIELLKKAPAVREPPPEDSEHPEQLGDFAVSPVNISGAFVSGYLYYPFTVERREMESTDHKSGVRVGRVVTSYVTKIVRSDGYVLDIVRLTAPRGTPRDRRVLALTDGTRIEKEPPAGHYGTWRLESLREFIKAKQDRKSASFRPLKQLLDEVVSYLSGSVWLPHKEDYTLLALYVALSFLYQVFDAIPLIMVCGEKGSGKSELGDAIARVSCNSAVVGQGSAAGIVRLINEARGMIVLDDLESIGRTLENASFGDINQMLKLSYKKRTGTKAITDRGGKTTVFDFYGPKVINNTRGVDPILGSRMIYIMTRRLPETAQANLLANDVEPDELARLRDDFHCWGMENVARVHAAYTLIALKRGNRIEEICAPLRSIAEVSDDESISESLELALKRQHDRQRKLGSPTELLIEAVSNCIRNGATLKLSMAQLSLELALLTQRYQGLGVDVSDRVWERSEWVGHQVRLLQIRDTRSRVKRVRLYGGITRIYDLNEQYVRRIIDEVAASGSHSPTAREPLAFCERMMCHACPYEIVCDATIAGLKESKTGNRGKSAQRAAASNA